MAKKKDEVTEALSEKDPLDGVVTGPVVVTTDINTNETVITPFEPEVAERDLINEYGAIYFEMQNWVNQRSHAYPSVTEQLAALYEARQGNDKPLKEIDAKIKEVKEKFPKPDFAKLEAKLEKLNAESPKETPLPTEELLVEKPAEE